MMENILTYILQVNLLLSLIYLGYYFLLKDLTFHKLNRAYFVLSTLYAFIYPFIDIKSWFFSHKDIQDGIIPTIGTPVNLKFSTTGSLLSLNELIIGAILIIGCVLLFRFIVQIVSLLRIHFHSKNSVWHSYVFRHVLFPIVPFSFFNKIYIHKEQHQESELQDIFAHESIHVKGHHTLDILLFEFLLIFCWYNPLVWLMRKAVRENLEFLTDQQVLNRGVDKQTYQYSLLHVTKQGAAVTISNQFNFKTLKKRIMMMNKKRTSKIQLSKYIFLSPIFLLAGMSFTVSKAENQIKNLVDKTQKIDVNIQSLNNPALTDKVLSKEVKPQEKLNVRDTVKKPVIGITASDALIILDDKVLGNDVEKLQNIDPSTIAKISVLQKPQATAKYGDKGAKGAVEVFSMEYAKKHGNEAAQKTANAFSKIVTKEKNLKGYANLIVTDDKNYVPPRFGKTDLKPLFVLNGEVLSADFDLNSIDPNDIKSIYILKDREATDRYGVQAKDGAVLISTQADSTIIVKGFKKEENK